MSEFLPFISTTESVLPTTADSDPFTDIITDYPNTCVLLSAISCVLSIFGALGIFCTYGLLPEIRNVTRKLIICLTMADLISASGYLISVYRYARIPIHSILSDQLPVLCKLQSAITTYSSMVSFLLTIFIGVHMAFTVVQQRDRTGTKVAFVVFNLISWIAPGIVVGMAFHNHAIGEDKSITAGTGPWCWIDTNVHRPILWMLVTGKGWEISCFLITISIYVLIKYYQYLYYHRMDLHNIHESLRKEDNNVLYLWFVLYILRLWGTVRFLIFAIDPGVSKEETYMKVLLYLQAFGDPAQAFFNFLLFCLLDGTVKIHMRRWLQSFRRRVTCENRPEVDRSGSRCDKTRLVDGKEREQRMPTYDSFQDYPDSQMGTGAGRGFTSSELVSLS